MTVTQACTGDMSRRQGSAGRYLLAVLPVVLCSVGICVGVYVLGRIAGGDRAAVLAMVMAVAVWLAMSTPVLAGAGDDSLWVWLKVGCASDSVGITLLILCMFSDTLSLLVALKMYCTYLSLVVLAAAAGRLAKTQANRHLCGIVTAVILLILLGSPLWAGGLLQFIPREYQTEAAALLTRLNPMYSLLACLPPHDAAVWHFEQLMYHISDLGENYAVGPVQWYWCGAIYLPIAGLLAASHLVRRGNQS